MRSFTKYVNFYILAMWRMTMHNYSLKAQGRIQDFVKGGIQNLSLGEHNDFYE